MVFDPGYLKEYHGVTVVPCSTAHGNTIVPSYINHLCDVVSIIMKSGWQHNHLDINRFNLTGQVARFVKRLLHQDVHYWPVPPYSISLCWPSAMFICILISLFWLCIDVQYEITLIAQERDSGSDQEWWSEVMSLFACSLLVCDFNKNWNARYVC